MNLNEKSESIVFKGWIKESNGYFSNWDGYDQVSEWHKKTSLEQELEDYFGLDWDNHVEIHEIKVTQERIK